MNIEDLDALYDRANRVMLGRSVAAAGKALVFTATSLDDAATEIAEIYGLTEEERSAIASSGGGTAVATIQDAAAGLMGKGARMDARRAISIAKTAIDGGRKVKAVAALVKAGPSAAEAVAAGGQVASKATVWGWVATAAYAAGTGSWFAYNLRNLNLAAYETLRQREGLEAPAVQPSIRDAATARLSMAMGVAAGGARAVGEGAGAAVRGVARGGGWLTGAAGGLFRRSSSGRKAEPKPSAGLVEDQ